MMMAAAPCSTPRHPEPDGISGQESEDNLSAKTEIREHVGDVVTTQRKDAISHLDRIADAVRHTT